LAERWRKPVIPIAIEQVQQGLWLPDGRIQGEAQLVLSGEDIDRIRAGYVCAKCLEPHEEAWPERCSVCGSPMRTEQAAYIAREFGGNIGTVGKTTDWEAELAGLDERRRKQEEADRKGRS
jgi:hypothetical protein